MIGWNASIWSKGRLLKGPVLVKIKSCGKSAQPLQMEESKYLAMSLVLDKFEHQDMEAIKNLITPTSK